MKQKLMLLLLWTLIVLGVRCSPTIHVSPIPNTPTRIDTPAIVMPTVQPSPMANVTATRIALPTASPSRILVPIASPAPTQGGEKSMSSASSSIPGDSKETPFVQQAKEDLAKRLSIGIDQISLVEMEFVTWPDGSLGCPQPGMMYTQVLVEGYLIRLSAKGQIYEYHGAGNRSPFLCQSKP